MGFAFQPVRGNWRIVEFDTTSTATFGKGSPVALGGARTLVEATVGSASLIGIALQRSVDSFPSGKVQVAVPMDRSAVFTADIETDVAASAISVGECYTIEKSGNTLRIDVDSQASAFVQIVGTPNVSATSRVEAVFLWNILTLPSESSSL